MYVTYNVVYLLCPEVFQIINCLWSADKDFGLPPHYQLPKMVVLNDLLCSLLVCTLVSGPEGWHEHLVAPVEPVVSHPVRVAGTTHLHVLSEAQISDLIGHELIVVFCRALIGVGHDTSHIVWGLWIWRAGGCGKHDSELGS